jgi:hypothetical protein
MENVLALQLFQDVATIAPCVSYISCESELSDTPTMTTIESVIGQG